MLSNDDWDIILYALQNDNLILLLGPEAVSHTKDQQTKSLAAWLSNELVSKLPDKKNIIDIDDLLQVATEYLRQNGSRIKLEMLVDNFYKTYNNTPNEVLQFLAEIPFSLAITTTPDLLLHQTLTRAGSNYQSAFYNFRKKDDTVYDIGKDYPPLIYQLFGSIKRPESMLLTEADQLSFLTEIMQRESSIPKSIAKEFDSSKNYLFVGFDFNNWQLRVLMHALHISDSGNETTWAMQPTATLSKSSQIFFANQFRVQFADLTPADFFQQLKARHAGETPPPPTTDKQKNICFIYTEIDQPYATELEKQLALLQHEQQITTWTLQDLQLAQEQEQQILQQIQNAQIILLFISADFIASDQIYQQQLQIALQKHREGKAIVFPILTRPTFYDGAAFAKLPTILPRNKKFITQHANPDEAYQHIVQEIDKMLQILWEITMQAISS